MVEIIKILNTEQILENYPLFVNMQSAWLLNFGYGEKYYAIDCAGQEYNHLRLIYSDQFSKKNLNTFYMQTAMNAVYGDDKVGLYVLPAQSQLQNGANTEHLFLNNETKQEYKNTLVNNQKDIFNTITFYNGKAKYFVSYNENQMTIRPNFAHCFNFYSMMQIKKFLYHEDIQMVATISSNNQLNGLTFYKNWCGPVPNLNKMYDYTPTGERALPLDKIIQDQQSHR